MRPYPASVPWLLVAALAWGAPVARAAPQDLGALLDSEPDLWVEVGDLDRLSAEVAGTSLGRLARLLTADLDPAEIALRLSLPEEALRAAAGGDAREVLRGLAIDLGLDPVRADALVASLAGGLTLARAARDRDAPELAGLALAASLRPGGSLRLAQEVLPELEPGPDGRRRQRGLELLQLAQEGPECRAAWSWQATGELPPGFVVVRPGMVALTFERDLAERLLGAAAPEGGDGSADALARARSASRERGELVFARVSGERLARAGADPEARVILGALGLDGLVGIELGIGTRAGQLTSRVRLERPAAREGPAPDALAGREPADWSSLELITTDTLAVLGVARSPWATAELVAGLTGERSTSTFLERLGKAPLFGALRGTGALRSETLVFVRAYGPGVPMLYAATPATPVVDKAFDVLGRGQASDVPLGKGLMMRRRPLSDGEAWILYSEERGAPRSVFALTRAERSWVGSDVSAQLQSLLRQRGRERLAARAQAVRRLRQAIAEEVAAARSSPQAVVAFLHVRAAALAELLWPYAQLALQVTGAVDDPEALPDPLDLAESLGDTTVVVLDLGDAVELRGCGLLGGLTVVF
jgi:hypothetical protein